MPKTITTTYCGAQATGRTLTEARQHACRRLASLVEASNRGPIIVRVRAPSGEPSIVVVAYYTIDGAGYQLLYADRDSQSGLHWTPGTVDDAAIAGVRHAAQNVWTFDCPSDGDFIASLPLLPAAKREDLRSYFAWQRRYRDARAAGHGDQAAHAIASGLSH